MPRYKNPDLITVNGNSFEFSQNVLKDFPDARGFIGYVLSRNVSAAVATTYVKIVARLKRQGRLTQTELLTHAVERTAANNYWRWTVDAYTVRVTPVARALSQYDVRSRISWLRRHSLLPPYPDKRVPRLTRWPRLALDGDTRSIAYDPGETTLVPCSSWTLHVPPRLMPVHTDPCMDCTVIELTDPQLNVIADAFEATWGHRDLERVPPECLLFGQPPPDGEAPVIDAEGIGRTVALMSTNALSGAIENTGGSVTLQVETFLARLEGADSVLISKKLVAERGDEVVAAVRTWLS